MMQEIGQSISSTDLGLIESWAQVDGFPCYWVSDQGRVACKSPNQCGYVVSSRPDKDGHYTVLLARDGKKYSRFVARLVAIAFIPNPQGKPEVNHKDGKRKFDNTPSNLEWATRSEQTFHSMGTGLQKRPTNPRRVLKPSEIKQVRALHTQGMSNRGISKAMGVGRTVVINLLQGRTHKLTPMAGSEGRG